MAITIKKVTNKSELKKFIRLNYELYKNNPYSVPDLYDDMLNTFNKKKNAAFEFCDADYFLAYKDNELVGRVAAIINHKANSVWNKKEVRFGWIDFIDDQEVSGALIKAVEEWGKERGMEYIQGPWGLLISMRKACWLKALISLVPWLPLTTIRIIRNTWSG